MELKDIQRDKKAKPKRISITLRIPLEVSLWMKKENISPTMLFEKTARELMSKSKTGGK